MSPSAPTSVIQNGTILRVSPVDLQPLAAIEVSTRAEVGAAIEAARRAQPGWSERSLDERVAAMSRAAKSMLANRDEVLAIMRSEVGKLEVDALFSEVLGALDQVSSWAAVIRPQVKPQKVGLNPLSFPNKTAWIERIPRGVVGIIAPWNFPFATLFRTVYPALMTGNGVVLKPSEHGTRVAKWFCERLQAELPPGLLNVVRGGRETGVSLIEGGIDSCIFTGSVGAGRDVSRRCGERLIPCSVELGGNDAAIVLNDCDLPRTCAGITHWALQNVGQSCGAVEIAYVDARIADAFVAGMERAWSRLRAGDGAPGEVDISPLANPQQLALVEDHVADALAKGAKLISGGTRVGRGLAYAPTLLDHCDDSMKVVADETFGPVLAIVRVDGASEAIARVNAGRYGLTCSIWSADLERATRLAKQIDVGTVTINNHSLTGAITALPWSGTRDSGPGVANSALALHTFLRPKSILVDHGKAPELFWMPFDKQLWELGNLLVDAQLPKLHTGLLKLPLYLRSRVESVRRFFAP